VAVSGRERAWWIAGASVLVLILAVFLFPPAWTQHPNIPAQPGMSGMDDMSDMAGMPDPQHGAAVPEQTPEVLARDRAIFSRRGR